MSMSPQLPEQFIDLQSFVEEWALPNERERFRKLHHTTLDELRVFYNAMLPRMDAILDYLDGYPINDMPETVKTLFHLAMTFAETAHPIDLGWNAVDFPSAYPWDRMEFRTVSIER